MSGKQARRRRVTRSEAEWRAIVKRFERSGLSRGEFCGREGVAASSLSKWRQEFDRFQRCDNEERPHDGIDGDLPCERWEPSPRLYPERILPPEYPGHLEVRRVSAAGTFRLKAKQPFLSNALADEYVGLEEIGDGLWNIVYYRTLLGRIDERTGRITGL